MPFWQIRASTDEMGTPEILIYQKIGKSGIMSKGVEADEFLQELRDLGPIDRLNVRINSGGGNVFTAQAIYSVLRDHSAEKHVYIDGIAASAASVIAMAGDVIHIPNNGTIMIHNPRTRVEGTAKEMRECSDVLDVVRDTIVAVYVNKTGLAQDVIVEMMNKETWLKGEDAVRLGFADVLEHSQEVAAYLEDSQLMVNGIAIDTSEYHTCPYTAQAQSKTEGEKDMPTMESILAKLDADEQEVLNQDKQAAVTAAVADASTSVLTEAQAAWEQEKAALEAKLAEATEPPNVQNAVDIEANLPAEAKALLEAARTSAAEAQARLQQMEDEKELNGFVNQIQALDKLPIGADLAPVFRNFAKADKEGFAKVSALLSAANEAIASGQLFESIGSTSLQGSSAYERLNAHAAKLMQADKTLTKEKAFAAACQAYPDLYTQHRKESEGEE